jgi:hypothetical protein
VATYRISNAIRKSCLKERRQGSLSLMRFIFLRRRHSRGLGHWVHRAHTLRARLYFSSGAGIYAKVQASRRQRHDPEVMGAGCGCRYRGSERDRGNHERNRRFDYSLCVIYWPFMNLHSWLSVPSTLRFEKLHNVFLELVSDAEYLCKRQAEGRECGGK